MNINKVNPATLKITDMRFADIDGAPKRCTLMKLYTNQGLVGYGEVRDASSRTYAAMLKSRILGENPCNEASRQKRRSHLHCCSRRR